MVMGKGGERKQGTEQVVDRARRRLLAKALYIPPAVIGALALSQEGCQPVSCNPPQPCPPNGEPCNPPG